MKNFLIILLVIDVIILNLGLGYLIFGDSTEKSDLDLERTIVEKCDANCKKEIEDSLLKKLTLANPVAKVTNAPLPTVAVTPTSTPKPTVTTSVSGTSKKYRYEEILTIPGSGSTISNDWASLSGTDFYFDLRDYPGASEIYFESEIALTNGNGLAYVRLFDVTNGIGVSGSENNTSSQALIWTKSQKVNFWSGKNLIRVQAKSLTADTAVYSAGRIRIIGYK